MTAGTAPSSSSTTGLQSPPFGKVRTHVQLCNFSVGATRYQEAPFGKVQQQPCPYSSPFAIKDSVWHICSDDAIDTSPVSAVSLTAITCAWLACAHKLQTSAVAGFCRRERRGCGAASRGGLPAVRRAAGDAAAHQLRQHRLRAPGCCLRHLQGAPLQLARPCVAEPETCFETRRTCLCATAHSWHVVSATH